MNILLIIVTLFSALCYADSKFNIEVGRVKNSYNKVKIDGDDGTLFNLRPSFEEEFYYRLSYIQKLNERHGLRFLYAPLKLDGKKQFSKDINFSGVNFSSNGVTDTEYQFNSYRGTYFYQLVKSEEFNLNLGGTLKVRDAKVKLKQGSVSKTKRNTGLVPLVYLYSEYKWKNGLQVALDFDGLMAPQGRAFDVAVLWGYNFSPSLQLNLGYRMLEGGVDNENVYNFSQLNYYFTSVQIGF